AFTLAETLITLAIIGVVAAMTIPSVLNHYQKQETIAKLKKAYTTLNQVMQLSELDNGSYDTWQDGYEMGAMAYIETYFLPYFKVAAICHKYNNCGYEKSQPWYALNGSTAQISFSDSRYRYPFITNDGILYSISVAGGSSTKSDRIYVDINASNKPNMAGKDFFQFERVSGNLILPYGYNLTDDKINSDCSKDSSGCYCAAKIMRDNWQIKSDYPW
ncbi:MAG: type II secretion system GspH family protein, partial [Candidatus Gastranaerophilales bacterium]|nr:type II secretion system GspH family protein [Candidatus Gastranaerophilales bacterium]